MDGCGCGGQCGPCSGQLGQLGIGICTSGSCAAGVANIQQMDSVYQAADPDTQAQFQSAHDGIMATFNSTYSWYSPYIPFNPTCCGVGQLGEQAAALTVKMQVAMGQTPVTAPPAGDGSSNALLWIGAGVALVLLLRR